MDTANQPERKRSTSLRRNRIARVVFQAAESMGMPDRKLIERLTAQVIKRLEQSPPPPEAESPEQRQPLPGMEHLVLKPRQEKMRLPTDSEIQTMVEEILARE